MSEIRLIGITPGRDLSEEQRSLLRDCATALVSPRLAWLLAGFALELVPIAPLAQALAAIEARLPRGPVAVLAGGDPLFFGIGRSLIARFGRERLRVAPGLSAMQLACARFAEPWDDFAFVSLHGRSVEDLAARILPQPKVFCFTDGVNSPDAVARILLAACENLKDHELAAACRLRVAENLGASDEQLREGSLAEIASGEFSPLSVMLFTRPQPPAAWPRFGLSEDDFSHSRGLITKDEVRAATLQLLSLPERGVLWDIGAGSGSVALSAARLCPNLMVQAVERRPEELDNIRANCRKFAVYNVRIVTGEAPSALAGLPDPDRVFIGGSGGQLPGIIASAAARLKPGGRLVANAVTGETLAQAPGLFAAGGLSGVRIIEIAVRRLDYPAGERQTNNSISIIVGNK